jgi:hypothetical protein
MIAFVCSPVAHGQLVERSTSKEVISSPSTYFELLRAPMSSLVGNVSERADVSLIAILGYI